MAGFKRRTLQELLSVDLNKLTKAELQGYKKVARDEVARTLKRWEGREYKSPAYYQFDKATGGTNKISFSRDMTLQQQKHELKKAIRFLSNESRTVEGWNEVKKQNIKKINEGLGITKPEEGFDISNYDRLYEAYDKAKEIDPNIESQQYRYRVFDRVADLLEDETKSADEIALEMAEARKKIYIEDEEASRRKREDLSQPI